MTFSSARLARTLVFELLFGFWLAAYLDRRGYRWANWTLPFAAKDVPRAVAVWIYTALCVLAGALLFYASVPSTALQRLQTGYRGHPAIWLALIASPVNAIFEEGLWLGFAVNVPGRKHWGLALGWSVLPRWLMHLYQGWRSVFLIGPIGLWFFWYYRRTHRLWPIILAHTLQDILAFGVLVYRNAG